MLFANKSGQQVKHRGASAYPPTQSLPTSDKRQMFRPDKRQMYGAFPVRQTKVLRSEEPRRESVYDWLFNMSLKIIMFCMNMH